MECRRNGELSAGRKARKPQCAIRIPLPQIGPVTSSLYAAIPGNWTAEIKEEEFFMQKLNQNIYRTPFSKAYWRDALREFRSLRTLVFSALMIAACVALAHIPSVPVVPGVKLTSWGFLARSLCALVGGPLNALVFGLAEDTISYLLHPTGVYFPGYALTTMLGTFIYAIFLYRARVTVLRILLAKLCNTVQNIFLGSLWSAILSGKGYLYYVTTRVFTNFVRLPLEVLILAVLLAALLPILRRVKIIPNQLGESGRIAITGFHLFARISHCFAGRNRV